MNIVTIVEISLISFYFKIFIPYLGTQAVEIFYFRVKESNAACDSFCGDIISCDAIHVDININSNLSYVPNRTVTEALVSVQYMTTFTCNGFSKF